MMSSPKGGTERYRIEKDGKDWRILHETGVCVAAFRSRSGLPASSLEIRARARLRHYNEHNVALEDARNGR